MSSAVWPVLVTMFTWWFTTGAILYLDGLDRASYKWTMGAFTLVLAGALWGVHAIGWTMGETGAYAGFFLGIAAWAWHEMSFLTGFVTGPRKSPCPARISPAGRFMAALSTILWHELAILAVGVLLAWATWEMPNKAALWTYCILWAMRTSAKLNLFLGARNLSEEFLPDHMRYLATYFRKANINMLFPFAVTIASAIVVMLAEAAFADGASAFTRTSNIILATLLALAVLEHWLMMLPIPANRLWSWGLASHNQQQTSNLPGLGKTITPAE